MNLEVSDAQKVFILKQGNDVLDCLTWSAPASLASAASLAACARIIACAAA
ncbi:hypothetical protein J2R96_002040 [Bradyrhizobium elkanii]|nr:hypothetical protein [Bradyrhizobium elkanii]